jgi:hypothetical protein
MTPTETVLARHHKVRRMGAGWEASCPLTANHKNGDRRRSLAIKEGDNSCMLLRCHKDCATADIVGALGLQMRDLFAQEGGEEWTPRSPALANYQYTDEQGRLLFGVCRTADKQSPQWRPDATSLLGRRWNLTGVRWVLYRLPEVRRCAEGGDSGFWRVRGYGDFLEQRDPDVRKRQADVGPRRLRGCSCVAGTMTSEQYPDDIPSHWSITFSVDDADAIADRTAKLGGKVLVPPVDAPWVRRVVLSDPQRAVFIPSKFTPPTSGVDPARPTEVT